MHALCTLLQSCAVKPCEMPPASSCALNRVRSFRGSARFRLVVHAVQTHHDSSGFLLFSLWLLQPEGARADAYRVTHNPRLNSTSSVELPMEIITLGLPRSNLQLIPSSLATHTVEKVDESRVLCRPSIQFSYLFSDRSLVTLGREMHRR